MKRVSGSTLLRNAKKLDKSLQMTSMPGYFEGIIKGGKDMHRLNKDISEGIIKEEKICMAEVANRTKMGKL